MRDFDPHRIASLWHSGQGSALYAYMSTGRIPTEDFKDRLVGEIESSMAGADDEALDELEYLLMSVEEQDPERLEMREADKGCKCGKPGCDCDECSECSGMVEADATCNECGGMKLEGPCECELSEMDEADIAGWLKKTASKVKDVAMTDVGGPEGFLTPADRAQKHGKSNKGGESDAYRAWKEKRAKNESVLRKAVSQIVREMKLGVAGVNPYGFGGGSEVDDKDVAHFLLSKKKEEEPAKSGVKRKTKAKAGRKSKKAD